MLRALLDAGVPVDCSSSPAETTPLHLSAGFSRSSCVHELLKRGANPTKRNKRGATPLAMVGTLMPPLKADVTSRTKVTLENKLANEMDVRVALSRAQKWQRRRGAILAAEALRRRARATAGAEGGVAVAVASSEWGGSGDSRKRCRRPRNASAGGARDGAKDGWLFAHLCAHPDRVMIRNVVKFL